jgi:hypothetical protein
LIKIRTLFTIFLEKPNILGIRVEFQCAVGAFKIPQLQCKAVPLHSMEVEKRYTFHTFMTLELDEGEWSASHPSHTLPLAKGSPVPVE